jgi:putative transcriptional regulator
VKSPTSRIQLALLVTATLLMLGAFPLLLDGLREAVRPTRAPQAGLFLVARPGSVDGNFDQTVVLLVEAGGERTWGLVLNRLRTPQGDELPAGVARWGGPVHPERHTTLVRAERAPKGAPRILTGLHWLEGPPPEGLPPEASLGFAGFASWAPGQLEQELTHGGWLLVEEPAERVFAEPGSLWAECIARHL